MTIINRSESPVPANAAFTDTERQLLDRIVPDLPKRSRRRQRLFRLIWRGLCRLTDLCWVMRQRIVGN
jgi:hypothetical protein